MIAWIFPEIQCLFDNLTLGNDPYVNRINQ